MDVLEVVRADRVVAVVRAPSVADPAGLAGVLADAGIRCVEFTFTIPGVLRAIEVAAAAGALVGAGTVTEPAQAKDAIAAGARFVVSPVLVPEIVAPCRDVGVPVVLAALTPTEVLAAARAGSIAVKLFPASLGGPRYLRDLRGPLPHVVFIPSGGVDSTNAREFLEAGAAAVFAGAAAVFAGAAAVFAGAAAVFAGAAAVFAGAAAVFAGAAAVFAGTELVPPELVAVGAHEEIRRRTESFVAALG